MRGSIRLMVLRHKQDEGTVLFFQSKQDKSFTVSDEERKDDEDQRTNCFF